MKLVIIGGGVAAFEAANAARKFSSEVEITMISNEKVLPYRRPALSGLLADFKVNEKTFFIKPESFYDEQQITVKLNTRCTAITGDHVVLDDNSVVPFDKLVIATGGAACRPALPGADNSNVFTFRNYADLEKLDAELEKVSSAVVIGGGVLGLELAESMLKRNIKVTVLEMMPRIFAGKLSETESAEVEGKLSEIPGLELKFGVKVKEFTSAGAVLEDGTTIPGDIIVCSAGSRPALAGTMELPVKTGRGIIVDEMMRSSCENIFAAGDAAQFGDKCFGLYNDARTTGMIAGTNAAGGSETFSPATATPVRCFSFGLKLIMP
ncbi:MAG: NAD(P)/FAD-dependent oxidoreductase [Lentisphaeria bacterium]|nr:NAD(P)/FAD-dependent oxidoreductase [Lentisphaeria bacterium]